MLVLGRVAVTNGQAKPPAGILRPLDLRFYVDPATGEPHICSHGVDEAEVAEVLMNPVEDRPGRDGSRVGIGATAGGRYLKVVYVRDPKPDIPPQPKEETAMKRNRYPAGLGRGSGPSCSKALRQPK